MTAVGYGHAEGIARILSREAAEAAARPTAPPVDPELYDRPEVRAILAKRDVAGLFRAVNAAGVSQRRIAVLVVMSQSEVSEILSGRKVLSYDVLVRVADGLHVPRGRMGLAYDSGACGEDGAYADEVTIVSPEEVIAMLRRRLIALGGGVAAGAPLAKLAPLLECLDLPEPSPVPLPSRVSGVHVAKVRDLTRRLGDGHRAYGPDPEVCGAVTAWASRLLDVSGPESVKQALRVALAELHLQAGWAGTDAGLYERAVYHCGRALKLATEAGDVYCQAVALNRAGLATIEHDDPDEGLKLLQVGSVTAQGIPADEPRAVTVGGIGRAAVQAIALVDSATALSRLDYPESARLADTELARARELWQPTPADTHGDLDRPAACLLLDRGRLDEAEPFAAASVHRWEGVSQNGHTLSAVVQATVYVTAAEPRGLQLARDAIAAAARLTSFRVRKRLKPLVKALAARPGADYRDLARRAYHVCTTRV